MSKHPLNLLCIFAFSAAGTLFSYSGGLPNAKAQILFNDGEVNIVDGPSIGLEVRNGPGGITDPTTLNVVDGADISAGISTFENSILNMSGGMVANDIEASDDSIVSISGGIVVGEIQLAGNATGSFTGGEAEVFGLDGHAVATINGGLINDDLDSLGDGVLTVLDVFVDDEVDADDNGVMYLMGGIYDEDLTSAGNSSINISGGEYVRVFSRGANLSAEGGTVNVSGGVFGEAGRNDGGSALATLGGTLHFVGATIAGVEEGTAPASTFSAVLNGQVNISSVDFGDLVLDAGNNGTITAGDYTADRLTVSTIAGGTVNLLGSGANSLTVFAELNSFVNISGGEFLDSDLEAQSGSVITLRGTSFTVNGHSAAFGNIPEVAGEVQGILANGDSFSATFRRQFFPVANAAQIVLMEVPEPGSALLLSSFALSMIGLSRVQRTVG